MLNCKRIESLVILQGGTAESLTAVPQGGDGEGERQGEGEEGDERDEEDQLRKVVQLLLREETANRREEDCCPPFVRHLV